MAASDQISKKQNKPVFPRVASSVGKIITADGKNDRTRIDPPVKFKLAALRAKCITVTDLHRAN